MQFDQLWELKSDNFCHHHCVTEISAYIPTSVHFYFLGRERESESTQSQSSSRSLQVKALSVSIQKYYKPLLHLSKSLTQFSINYQILLDVEGDMIMTKLEAFIIIKMRQIIIAVLSSMAAIPIEGSHLHWRHHNNHEDDGSAIVGVLIFLMFLFGGIAYLVYRCRRRQNTMMPPPLLIPPQPPIYRPNMQINPYQGFQTNNFPMPNNRYNHPSPLRAQNDLTRAANQSAYAQKWQGPDYFAQKRLREGCACCNNVTRYGQEPKIVLSCPEHHVFHISCLNQFRVSRTIPSSDNKSICPACSMPAPDRVRLFCIACKQNYIWVQLSKFSDQDRVIDITALKNQYGEYCKDCRNG